MSSPPPRAGARVLPFFAAILCFFFAATLLDVALSFLAPQVIPAPPLPESMLDRDAELVVTVVDEGGRPLPGASVRVFAMRDEKAYFAGDRRADLGGRAPFNDLPRGEAWVLVYDGGRARASTRVVLDRGAHDIKLVLRPAKALDVVVVDESGGPVEGAELRVATGDPLPYLAFTDAEGRARIDRLGPAPYLVTAKALGYDDTARTGVVPGSAPLRLKLERLGALVVTVVGLDGVKVPGATVLCAGVGLWPAHSAVTDASGQTRIGGLKSGVYDLKAKLEDRVSATELAVPVKHGEAKEVELTLLKGRSVKITVTDGDGEAAPKVPNASVLLVEEGLSPFPLQGRTDASGEVVLGPITMGIATISARAKGFVPTTAVPVGDFDTEARVSLRRGAALIGDVVDDRGFPVASATIEVVGVDTDGMPIDETSAMIDFRDDHFDMMLAGPSPLIPMGELGVMPGPIPDLPREGASIQPGGEREGDPWVTRADGTFRAEPIAPGRVHAIVRHPEYVEAISETVTLKPGGEASVHVVLRQGGTIVGRVLEEDRTPVAGARIELAATGGSLERVTIAADDGTFTFASVPDEVLLSVARADAPADVAARIVVSVPEREKRDVEVILPKVRDSVAIHVADDRGYPLSRVEVRALSLDAAVPLRRTLFTSDDGDVEIYDALGLPLRITLLRPTKSPLVEAVESAPAKLSYVMNPGIQGRGRVTGKGGRDKVEGATVTLYTESGARRARTDQDGEFIVDDLAPGRVRIVVAHADYASAEVVTAAAGDPDHPADFGSIDLSPAGSVEGVVLDSNDDPVPGARVAKDSVPTYLPLGPLPPGITTSDREGRFTLRGLPEGNVTIAAASVDQGRAVVSDIAVRSGRTTSDVKITLPGEASTSREPKGAGSVAVTLGERTEQGRKIVLVMMVPPGSEAEVGGIEPGDQLIAVNGQEVKSIEDARRRLTGPLAEDVIVSLGREGVMKSDKQAPPKIVWLARIRRERVRR